MDQTTLIIPYVRWAGISIAAPGSVTPTRRLYDHEITYVLSGEGDFCFADQLHRAGPDSCFFTPPREPHSLHNASEVPWVTLGVHFDWTWENIERFPTFRADDGSALCDETLFRRTRLIAGWNPHERALLHLSGRPLTRHFLEEAQTAFARWDSVSLRQAGALLQAAVVQIEREVNLIAQGKGVQSLSPDAQRRLNDARGLLEQVCESPLSVAEVAQRVDWSADYLAFMARSAWGVTPRRLQNDARLRHARKLLGEGTSVAEVARVCGFADTSHLARAFRKDSGLTPREYSALASRK